MRELVQEVFTAFILFSAFRFTLSVILFPLGYLAYPPGTYWLWFSVLFWVPLIFLIQKSLGKRWASMRERLWASVSKHEPVVIVSGFLGFALYCMFTFDKDMAFRLAEGAIYPDLLLLALWEATAYLRADPYAMSGMTFAPFTAGEFFIYSLTGVTQFWAWAAFYLMTFWWIAISAWRGIRCLR